MPWKLTVRAGHRVDRERHANLQAALASSEVHAHRLSDGAPRTAVDARIRRFEPAQQVIARIELAGPQRLLPSVRAGIDVRGDGSSEAFTGRVRRQLVRKRKGESAARALARVLGEDARYPR